MAQLGVKSVAFGDLVYLLRALRNRAFGKAGLAQATTTTQVKITNQTDYMVDGVIARKAATDNISLGSLTNTGAATKCKIRVEIDAAGTVSFVQGPLSVDGAQVPRRSAGKATLGVLDVPNSFTFGTTTTNNLTYTDGDPDLNASPLMADYVQGGLES